MPLLRKRKERKDNSPFNKRKKVLPESEDANKKDSQDLNSEIKVENEFDNLFEEEADLSIKEDLEDIKLDIFSEDLESFGNELACQAKQSVNSNQEGILPSISIEENKSLNLKNSASFDKIISKQKEALKLIRIALRKFESVTKDFQEMVEYDIEEAHTDLDTSLDSTCILKIDDVSPQCTEDHLEDMGDNINSSINSPQITSIEGRSCDFEDSVSGSPANFPIEDKLVCKTKKSSGAVTQFISDHIQPSNSSNTVHENEEQSSANLPVENKNVGINKASSPAITQTKVAQTQPKDSFSISLSSNAGHGEKQILGQKNQKLKRKCVSKKNICAKVPCVVLNDIKDRMTPISTLMKSGNADEDNVDDNGASDSLSENLNDAIVFSLDENHVATNSSKIKDNRPSTSHGQGRVFRPCIYCGKSYSRLRRHLVRVHLHENEVNAASKLNDKYEQKKAFNIIKKKGIFNKNINLCANIKPEKLLRERQRGEGRMSVCSNCKGLYLSRCIRKHLKRCKDVLKTDQTLASAISFHCFLPLDEKMLNKDPDFISLVSGMREDAVGLFCKENELIKYIGFKILKEKLKVPGKEKQKFRLVRWEMRLLADFFFCFREELSSKANVQLDQITFETLFTLKYKDVSTLPILVDMLKKSDEYSNRRLYLQPCFNRATKILIGKYSYEGNDSMVFEVKEFIKAFSQFIGDFLGETASFGNTKPDSYLKLPEMFPAIMSIHTLWQHVATELEKININDTTLDFIHLRCIGVTRLMCLNGRRGGIATYLKISDWESAKKGTWVNEKLIQQFESSRNRELLQRYKLVYIYGNESQRVPLLIPSDCVKILDLLCDEKVRQRAAVSTSNKFVFALTHSDHKEVTGNSDIQRFLLLTNMPRHIKIINIRSFLNTNLSNLDLSTTDGIINKNVHQFPFALQEMSEVGNLLDIIDGKIGQTKKDISLKTIEDMFIPTLEDIVPVPENVSVRTLEDKRKRCSSVLQNSKKRLKWSKEDCNIIKKYFSFYINKPGQNSKGNLPGKREILRFREKFQILPDTSPDSFVKKVRTQVFNLRQRTRKQL